MLEAWKWCVVLLLLALGSLWAYTSSKRRLENAGDDGLGMLFPSSSTPSTQSTTCHRLLLLKVHRGASKRLPLSFHKVRGHPTSSRQEWRFGSLLLQNFPGVSCILYLRSSSLLRTNVHQYRAKKARRAARVRNREKGEEGRVRALALHLLGGDG